MFKTRNVPGTAGHREVDPAESSCPSGFLLRVHKRQEPASHRGEGLPPPGTTGTGMPLCTSTLATSRHSRGRSVPGLFKRRRCFSSNYPHRTGERGRPRTPFPPASYKCFSVSGWEVTLMFRTSLNITGQSQSLKMAAFPSVVFPRGHALGFLPIKRKKPTMPRAGVLSIAN